MMYYFTHPCVLCYAKAYMGTMKGEKLNEPESDANPVYMATDAPA